MKKIYLALLFVFTIVLVGCSNTTGQLNTSTVDTPTTILPTGTVLTTDPSVTPTTVTPATQTPTTNSIIVPTTQDNPFAPLDLAFENVINPEDWNMKAVFFETIEGYSEEDYYDTYEYDGLNFLNSYLGSSGDVCYDYYVTVNGIDYLYYDNCDGTYDLYDGDSYEYEDSISYCYFPDFASLKEEEFEYKNGLYIALDPQSANDCIFGAYVDEPTYDSFTIKVENNNITEIVCKYHFLDEGVTYNYTDMFTFSKFGEISIDPESLEDLVDEEPAPTGNTTLFIDQYLASNSGSEYVTTSIANSYDMNRGVQFLQNAGDVTITSKSSQIGVKSVTIVCNTNSDTGFTLKVSVGSTIFTCDGVTNLSVPKSDYTANLTYTFSTSEKVDGIVKIEMIASAASKSMYILSVSLSSDGESTEPVSVAMDKQEYSSETFSDDRLQDKIVEKEDYIGLSSTGTYNVLVVPVEFVAGDISASELEMLNKAFNGTSEDTGWESVKSFYQASSYGKLNMTFDIQNVFTTSNNATYYQNNKEKDGSTIILLEVLEYLEPLIDLSKYDNDGDGAIDGVYLIYDYTIDYETDSDFFWAYVSWYYGEDTFDSLDAYFYLFAGLDFMIEDAVGGYEYNGIIDGLEINAATYIHETGHMLGLDDYYDYFSDKGEDSGLGGADMMDSTIGDHCSYSKIMLDWITPEIVNETKTVTLENFETTGDSILILLDSVDGYFSEYLLIDLYTPTVLNEMHAGINFLYEDAPYGVRIYHVSNQVDQPCTETNYPSFTNYNNSITDYALIELVQADGGTKFGPLDYVYESDLWQAGDKLLEVFPSYARNDGKTVCFDIEIVSVSAESATITITFNEA